MSEIERLMVPGQLEPVSHYCHVTRAGKLVFVSGMVGIDRNGSIPPSVVEQFQVALSNLDACLDAVGGTAEHIVKVTVFLTNIADRALINPARQRYFGRHRPASTLVAVSALILPQLKVEIEAQAVLPD
ncbi:MAG: RidA family protein [Acetobacteraceae bacterium]|nr:RidA family protein [Acetobacteraceae bacterium]